MHRGKNLFITIHNPGTGLPVLNVIFLQKEMGTYGQKEQQDCVICGASGQGIPHLLTGLTEEDLKLPGVMFMRAVVSNAMKIFFRLSLQKQGKMHTYIIPRQKNQKNFIALTVTLMQVTL
jgi:hypothetical protein